MATKKAKNSADKGGAQAGAQADATHEQSFLAVKPWHEAVFGASAKEPKWPLNVDHVGREIERLSNLMGQDRAAILAHFSDAERAALAESFDRIGPLARAASFVDRRAERQGESQQALSKEQYQEALKQVREDRKRLFEQAPVWVTMGLLDATDWSSIQSGNGPLNWAKDVEDLVSAAQAGWAKIEPMQQVVFGEAAKRIDASWLEAAATNARRLAAHIGRVDGDSPALKNIDWAQHARANRHLLAHHWQRLCDAAEYHYKRSGQRELVKERCVALRAMRKP